MYAEDLYTRRKRAGITRQIDLIRRLPNLPSGTRITKDFYGRIERAEVSIEPEVYNTIIATIDAIAAERDRTAA
jgi:hypothetical protein